MSPYPTIRILLPRGACLLESKAYSQNPPTPFSGSENTVKPKPQTPNPKPCELGCSGSKAGWPASTRRCSCRETSLYAPALCAFLSTTSHLSFLLPLSETRFASSLIMGGSCFPPTHSFQRRGSGGTGVFLSV